MFRFLLGVLILASNFLGVSRAIAATCQPITTLQELRDMGTTGNYCLANDIDASPTSTVLFTPIGDDANPFVGTFDGNGHVIDRLTIGSVMGPCCTPSMGGFFGSVGNGGTVRNVNITNAAIAQVTFVGLLVGENEGVVTNSSATGTLLGVDGYGSFGGLIGWNKENGQVSNSYAAATVDGRSPSGSGGFVGRNEGIITQSYASGQVTAFDQSSGHGEIGGFVGFNSGMITKCYATGNVTGLGIDERVGGFVGHQGGTISQSYAMGSVTRNPNGAYSFAGGFAGSNSAKISQSFSVGSLTKGGAGFVAYDYAYLGRLCST